jgi:N-methylhydantoinase A/oxoprolinase/acetone carboxylase beta subunit
VADRVARLGIDVGGTNTDAVVMVGDVVLASAKRLTTPDVSQGVINVVISNATTRSCGG